MTRIISRIVAEIIKEKKERKERTFQLRFAADENSTHVVNVIKLLPAFFYIDKMMYPLKIICKRLDMYSEDNDKKKMFKLK